MVLWVYAQFGVNFGDGAFKRGYNLDRDGIPNVQGVENGPSVDSGHDPYCVAYFCGAFSF